MEILHKPTLPSLLVLSASLISLQAGATHIASDETKAAHTNAISMENRSDLPSWTTAVCDGDNVIMGVTDASPKETIVAKLTTITRLAVGFTSISNAQTAMSILDTPAFFFPHPVRPPAFSMANTRKANSLPLPHPRGAHF